MDANTQAREDLIAYAKGDYMTAQFAAVTKIAQSANTSRALLAYARRTSYTDALGAIRTGYVLACQNLEAFGENPRFPIP